MTARSAITNTAGPTMTDGDSAGGVEHEGYGIEYTGFGFRCPECESVGTYLTCSECGYYMEGPDTPRYRGTGIERPEDS